jgi:nitrogen regulatory protein PII
VKLIIAIIQPTKLNAVRQALAKIGVERLTVCDAHGYGHRRGKTEIYRGRKLASDLFRKVALEIAVNDDFLDRTIETITNVARIGSEGSIGAGKILVLPMDEAIQIGPTSRGPEAV